MKMPKSIIILCVPRSGSVYLSDILYLYANRKWKFKRNLHMYFIDTYLSEKNDQLVKTVSSFLINDENINNMFYITFNLDEDNAIVRERKTGYQPPKEEESLRRIEIFDKSEKAGNYNVLHARMAYITHDVKDYLKNNFRGNIIISSRRDLWEQFLSACILQLTHVSFMKDPISIKGYLKDRPYHLSREIISEMVYRVNSCKNIERDMEEEWPGNYCVMYEDWVNNPLDNIPKLLPQFSDIREYVVDEDLNTICKKMDYPCSKEDMFSNIDEMREMFNNAIYGKTEQCQR